MRIDKYLTKTGLGSKKEVKNIIKKKLIYVDGEQIKSNSFSVTEKSNVYYLNNGKLEKLIYEEYIYLMLHKPKEYVCAKQDNLHKTVKKAHVVRILAQLAQEYKRVKGV